MKLFPKMNDKTNSLEMKRIKNICKNGKQTPKNKDQLNNDIGNLQEWDRNINVKGIQTSLVKLRNIEKVDGVQNVRVN